MTDQPVTRADLGRATTAILLLANAIDALKRQRLGNGDYLFHDETRDLIDAQRHGVLDLIHAPPADEAHRPTAAPEDECVWPTCQGDAMAPHAPADCTCDPNYEPTAAPDGDEHSIYTHQPSYDRGWQDAMGATLKAVTATPAGEFRDDVWTLVWCLNSGWRTAEPGMQRNVVFVDQDKHKAIEAACNRLTNWYRNPVAAPPTDTPSDAVRALREVEKEIDGLIVVTTLSAYEAGARDDLKRANEIVKKARLEAEGRQS